MMVWKRYKSFEAMVILWVSMLKSQGCTSASSIASILTPGPGDTMAWHEVLARKFEQNADHQDKQRSGPT